MGKVTIVITETAYSDLEGIETYISQDSPVIARRFISKIFDRIDILYDQPLIGKAVRELHDNDIRELLLNKYRIIYRVASQEYIEILRIIHGARLLDIEI